MKLNKKHDHVMPNGCFRHIPSRVRQYICGMYSSLKCKKMSHGSYDILQVLSWPRKENWRRNHPKSLKKHH